MDECVWSKSRSPEHELQQSDVPTCPASKFLPRFKKTESQPVDSSNSPNPQAGCNSDELVLFNLENMTPVFSNAPKSDSHSGLCVNRQTSSIPKTGTQKTWDYPSSLQFYKALELRNKNPERENIDDVVYVHNTVNEDTWKQILRWEKLFVRECATPSLKRFIGRCDDLTVKARWNSFFTPLGKPFDRHDWFIDRCGKQVRYVVDYYDDASQKNDIQVTIDARPAIDNFSSLMHRIRFIINRVFQSSTDR